MSEWDSFALMAMVTALEEEFKIELTLEEIMEMQSLHKIKQVLVKKLCELLHTLEQHHLTFKLFLLVSLIV